LEPTRGDNVLDLVFSSEEEVIQDVKVGETFSNSDHNMVRFSVACSSITSESGSKNQSVDFRKANWVEIQKDIQSVDWSSEFRDKSVDEQWCLLHSTLEQVVTKHVPTRKKNCVRKPKWMNREAFRSVKRKRKKWKKYKESGSHVDFLAYKSCQNETTRIIRESKKNFEEKLAQNIKKDTKSFYAYARDRLRCRVSVGPLEDESGELHSDEAEQANILNRFFVSVFTEEGDDERPEPDVKFTGQPEEKLCDVVINEEVVLKKLKNVNASKAPGADNISPALLAGAAEALAMPLSLLFQSSLDLGVVPEGWRVANVVPIFKKSAKSKAGNYRPVSLTSQVGKVFESILRDALNAHFDSFQLISDSQHGFSRGKSCLTNLLVYLEDVTSMLDSGRAVDVVYLDYAKAFDKVPHKRLVDKLRALGVDDKVLRWVQEWLRDRRQRVVINGHASEWADVTSGVPQGSILGPTLFLVFINDLEDGMLTNVLKFADDTKIYGDVTDPDGQEKLQHDLDAAERWSEKWLMQFNVDKCKTLHAGHGNPQATYTLGGRELGEVEEERDLGVIVHKSMSVSRQCCQAVHKSMSVSRQCCQAVHKSMSVSRQCCQAAKKANRVVGQIMRTVTDRSKEVIIPLYKSLVRPHMEYCIQAWRPHLKKDITVLEKVQRRTTKLVAGMRDLSYEERLAECCLPSLEQRRNRGDLIETFKIMRGLDKVPSSKFFSPAVVRHRGHSDKLFKSRSRLNIRKNFFSQRVVNPWNALPQDTINAHSTNEFKNGLDKLGGFK
jgi:hypothetical protein